MELEQTSAGAATATQPPPPALLSYAVTPTVVPYLNDPSAPGTVSLMIAGNNATGANQACPRLAVTLPGGAASRRTPAAAPTWSSLDLLGPGNGPWAAACRGGSAAPFAISIR